MVSIGGDTVAAWKRVTSAGGGGYTTTTRAKVLTATGATVVEDLPVTELQWEWDGTSTAPLSGTLTVPAVDWSAAAGAVDWRPTHTRAALTPFGNRISVQTGVDNGLESPWLPLGVGLIETVTYDRPAEVLTVTVADLAAQLDQAATVVDTTILAPITLGTMLQVLLNAAAVPADPPLADPGGRLASLLPEGVSWNPGTSLWDIAQDCVQLADPSARCWFDRDGSLRVDRLAVDTARPPAEVLAARPDYSLRTGDGGHLLGLTSTLTRRAAVNLVAVAVEDTEVEDPTYEDADTDPEPDERGARRARHESLVGKVHGGGGGFAKLTAPSGRTTGWTAKLPSPARWPFMNPAAHPMGAPFGAKGSVWSNNTHYGTDFSAPGGGTVVAAVQGKVVAAYPNGGPEGWAGRYVVQQASDGSRFYYCHLASVAVSQGQFLLRQATIGQAGDSGNAYGIHLHLERRDPPYRWAADCVDWRGGGPVK